MIAERPVTRRPRFAGVPVRVLLTVVVGSIRMNAHRRSTTGSPRLAWPRGSERVATRASTGGPGDARRGRRWRQSLLIVILAVAGGCTSGGGAAPDAFPLRPNVEW